MLKKLLSNSKEIDIDYDSIIPEFKKYNIMESDIRNVF